MSDASLRWDRCRWYVRIDAMSPVVKMPECFDYPKQLPSFRSCLQSIGAAHFTRLVRMLKICDKIEGKVLTCGKRKYLLKNII